MKNELMFYYGLDIKSFKQINNSYIFKYNNNSYIFTTTDRKIDEIMDIYNLSKILIENNIFCHDIILNNNGEILTQINSKNFILMKKHICSNEKISLNDIINFSIVTRSNWNFQNIIRCNWQHLWIDKIQNLEYQISHFSEKNQIILCSFNYYKGLVENGIQLITEIGEQKFTYKSVAHKRIKHNTTIDEFYNPLNFIIDYSIRDLAEYFKSKIISKIDITDEYIYSLRASFYDSFEKEMLFVRMLYPSYQLDAYEKFFFDKSNLIKADIDYLLISNDTYEKIIKKMYAISKTYIYGIPNIDWLNFN